MAFVNEVVSDADIDKYKLPFAKGGGRYWTRDAERDFYLWGGRYGNPAFGEVILGSFDLYMHGKLLRFKIVPGVGSMKYSDSPYLICWKGISRVDPADLCGLERDFVYTVLKDSLRVYGEDGRENTFAPVRTTMFEF
jgi:hypothetical protein